MEGAASALKELQEKLDLRPSGVARPSFETDLEVLLDDAPPPDWDQYDDDDDLVAAVSLRSRFFTFLFFLSTHSATLRSAVPTSHLASRTSSTQLQSRSLPSLPYSVRSTPSDHSP